MACLAGSMVLYQKVYWETFPFRYVPSVLLVVLSVFALVASLWWFLWYSFLLARSLPLLTITSYGFTDLTRPSWLRTVAWDDVAAFTVSRPAWGGSMVGIRRRSSRWPRAIDARLLVVPFRDAHELKALLEQHRESAQAG
ncbi:MAG: hypothetical protein KJ956_06710 [Actinobacteria bacterium]|nr:hypothetical protein [Actinomycetota bacterium]